VKLVGTVLHLGVAYAVYSDDPKFTVDNLSPLCRPLWDGGAAIFGPGFRLLQVGAKHAAPAVLPVDVSESLHEKPE
jgi:hypothetical protein